MTLGFEWGGGTKEIEEKKENEKEKIYHMSESIGHRSLSGPLLPLQVQLTKQGTGTADHLTLFRLFSYFFIFLDLTAPAKMLK